MVLYNIYCGDHVIGPDPEQVFGGQALRAGNVRAPTGNVAAGSKGTALVGFRGGGAVAST